MSKLVKANLLLFALLIVHTVDHGVNQPERTLPGSTDLAGALGFAITAGSSWLALRSSPLAPRISAAVGALTLAGVVAIHLLPNWWGWVSDPYWDFDADLFSWLSVIAVLGAAAYLAAAGLRAQRTPSVTEAGAPSAFA